MNCSITPALYREVADRLADAIDGTEFFSGTLALLCDGVECRFTATLLVYRRRERWPEGERSPIRRLVPVWWEFHTFVDGFEQLNDFDFSRLEECVVG